MEQRTENTVPEGAIIWADTERRQGMNNDYNSRLEQYIASMLQFKNMLSRGILTPDDYTEIDTILAERYGISSCSIYRGIDLIYR